MLALALRREARGQLVLRGLGERLALALERLRTVGIAGAGIVIKKGDGWRWH